MVKLSIIIPSKTEVYLNHTIKDVLKNATGNIEILPVLDGYEPDELVEDERVQYVRLQKSDVMQKRHGINKAVKESKGDYVMALDAHCMVAPGFDTQLIKDHQPNWVQIPRRNRLDAMNWCLQEQYGKPPIDYEYFMFRPLARGEGLHGHKWDERTLTRWDIPIDDTLEFQGSCWFMAKDWFNKMEFMQVEGYRGWGQEAEEIGFKTRLNGGEVKTNKNTWYAHLHKGSTYGRMYHMNQSEQKKSYAYSRKVWLEDNKDFFISVIEKFYPIPGWPTNWKELVWKAEKN